MRDEIGPFLSTLSHICVFLFFDTLPLVTPLSLLISLSFLKPLSIVFQDGIWLVCFNMVVCARKKKKKESIKKKKIKRVLIKFWEVKWKEGILLWRRRRGEKKCWMEIPKRVDIPTNLENTSYIYLYPFLFHSLCFYPTLRPNKVFIWSWRLCSSNIDMTEYKVWYKFFLASIHETTCSFLKRFPCDLHVRCLILLTLF